MKFKRKKKSFFLNRLKSKHYPLLFRRLAFLWVFLIFLEIACPIFECQIFAADLPDDNLTVSSELVFSNPSGLPSTVTSKNSESQEASIAGDDQSAADHSSPPEDCNDECLCHVTPIQGLSFVMPKDNLRTEISPIKNKFQPSSDLPPPYQPPQFS